MGELAGTPATPPASASAECLVNLTGHDVVLDAWQHLAAGEEPGLETASVVRLCPDGRLARVDDERARLSEEWLSTAADWVHLTRLRRSRRLAGLPARRPRTRYLVSRLTAQAAGHRGDLVFQLSEVRDELGQVTRAGGLGTYRPRLAVAERYRDWRAAASRRRSRRELPREWLTGLMFAAGTALLSAALALLPGVLDNAAHNGWAGGGQAWTTWLTVGFLTSGGAVLGMAGWRWLTRLRMLAERGTAYVIEEEAIHWLHEEKASVLAVISGGFASVLRVPGPEALGDGWRWQADAEGAPQWDARTDQLVHSFWAVHYNDDQATHNAVFVWAPWPVAMAFGARATARRRGLVLHVRQRPSGGAAGLRRDLRLGDSAHEFLRVGELPPLEAVAPHHVLALPSARATVTVHSLSAQSGSPPPPSGRQADKASSDVPAPTGPSAGSAPALLLLLVRLVDGDIGPIPLELEHAPEISLNVAESLASAALPPGTYDTPVAEWRLTAADRAEVPWRAFPVVAERIADWVEQQAADHPGRVILLAARMPQEIAVGLGIQLGQRSVTWPRTVYPMHYAGGRLMVPDLDLGRDSVPTERR